MELKLLSVALVTLQIFFFPKDGAVLENLYFLSHNRITFFPFSSNLDDIEVKKIYC